VAQLKEPQVLEPNRKGRSLVTVGGASFGVDADELAQLKPLLDKIGEAVRIANDKPLG
jgi:hypothetical protein